MTPKELDEIERMAEAATPGPWLDDVGVDFDEDEGGVAEWYACGPSHESRELDEKDGLPTLGAAKDKADADALFIAAMREHALPLVKALREAWEERDEARDEAAQLRELIKTARARLAACGYQVTEHAYQEMASVLDDLPAASEESK